VVVQLPRPGLFSQNCTVPFPLLCIKQLAATKMPSRRLRLSSASLSDKDVNSAKKGDEICGNAFFWSFTIFQHSLVPLALYATTFERAEKA